MYSLLVERKCSGLSRGWARRPGREGLKTTDRKRPLWLGQAARELSAALARTCGAVGQIRIRPAGAR
jgi:hypothetical protein